MTATTMTVFSMIADQVGLCDLGKVTWSLRSLSFLWNDRDRSLHHNLRQATYHQAPNDEFTVYLQFLVHSLLI